MKVRTTKNRVGTSSARILYASSGARIVFDPTTTVDNGTRVKVSGKLVAVRTGQPLAGRKVSILRDPAVGSSVRGTLVTSSTGRFSFTFAATSNTKITATSTAVRTPLGAIYVPPGTGASSQKVRAPLRCVVRDAVIASGGKGTGSCSAPGLPVGTPLILRYRYNGVWRTLASGQSSSASFPFVYQFPKSGFYQLRVILSGNRAYAGTNSALMSVTVR